MSRKEVRPGQYTDNGLDDVTRIAAGDNALMNHLVGAFARDIHNQADELDDARLDIEALEAEARR